RPPPTHTYTPALHDALPICETTAGVGAAPYGRPRPTKGPHHDQTRTNLQTPRNSRRSHHKTPRRPRQRMATRPIRKRLERPPDPDRKSTRLNSSHSQISYAV